MYPYHKVLLTLFKARFRPKLDIEDTGVIECRAGLFDIDMYMELNNARYLSYMELGRWDFAARSGFSDLMKKNQWGIAVGGISKRYRRRIPFLSRFVLTTKLICHDGRWFYFLQETLRDNKICSSAVIKIGVVSKQGLVAATEVIAQLDRSDWGHEIPDWVNAWIEAESLRPWPKD